jgi:hypothetical protein
VPEPREIGRRLLESDATCEVWFELELARGRPDAPSDFMIASCAALIPRKTSFESRCSAGDMRPNRAG